MKEVLRIDPQTFHAFRAEAADPFADGLHGRIELTRRCGLAHAALHYGTNHFLSTFRGQAGILVSVHSVLRESLVFGNISFPVPAEWTTSWKFTISDPRPP